VNKPAKYHNGENMMAAAAAAAGVNTQVHACIICHVT
jgi:hypothetical protein